MTRMVSAKQGFMKEGRFQEEPSRRESEISVESEGYSCKRLLRYYRIFD